MIKSKSLNFGINRTKSITLKGKSPRYIRFRKLSFIGITGLIILILKSSEEILEKNVKIVTEYPRSDSSFA